MSNSEQNNCNPSHKKRSRSASINLPHSHSASLPPLNQTYHENQASVPNQSISHLRSKRLNDELLCILCQHIMREAFSTSCGHSFCYECLNKHIMNSEDCPSCHAIVSNTEIYPNFQLNRLAELKKQVQDQGISTKKIQADYCDFLVASIRGNLAPIVSSLANTLSYADIETLYEATLEAKNSMRKDDTKIKFDLLNIFLVKLKGTNTRIIQNLKLQNKCIISDLDMLVSKQSSRSVASSSDLNALTPTRKRKISEIPERKESLKHQYPGDQSAEGVEVNSPIENRVRYQQSGPSSRSLLEASYADRIEKRFEDLTELYYTRLPPDYILDMTRSQRQGQLESFSSSLYDITKYDSLELKDTLYYTESTQSTSIVSSIEFDRDDEFFAVGGILKDIKIFDFKLTGQSSEDGQSAVHCPVSRISCDHKVSCLSWSSYLKSQLASSDYQGIVNVWDVTTGKSMACFSEHKKRAWSVDTSLRNPNMLASGSDDTTVKVWSINSPNSIFTFVHKGNICCAKFAPNNSNYLAVGSADHDILCYDLRFPSSPVRCYQGHQKAASYVRWMNDNELISASTDNSLKLWDRESTECIRTFSGHTNEKNFVGLSVTDEWIACGSETNMVYTYHKYSKIPVAQYQFPMNDIDGKTIDECDPTYFVSSVCWKKDASKLISANSKGIIYVLQPR